jgi:hypothetical protein
MLGVLGVLGCEFGVFSLTVGEQPSSILGEISPCPLFQSLYLRREKMKAQSQKPKQSSATLLSREPSASILHHLPLIQAQQIISSCWPQQQWLQQLCRKF